MNDEAVYRTAPATPGLLITQVKFKMACVWKEVQVELVHQKTFLRNSNYFFWCRIFQYF